MVKVKTLFAVTFLLAQLCAFAQDKTEKYNPNVISKSDVSDSSMIRAYWTTSSEFFTDPKVPQFIFVSPNSKFSLGIGGYVNVTANVDFNGYAEGPDLIPSLIETPNSSINDGQFNFDARHSRLFFKVIDKRANGKDVVAYVETDFRGGVSHVLRLRKAYISYAGFHIGQDWTTMLDLAAFPAMVNFQGPNAAFANRVVMFRYTYEINDRWKMAVAFEEPYFALNKTGLPVDFEKRPQHSPNIPAYVQYTKGGSHFRLSALLNPMYYYNVMSKDKHTAYGWATQLSGMVKVSSLFSFSFNGLYGEGIGNQCQDLYDEGYTLIPKAGDPSTLRPLPMVAAYGNLIFNISPKVFSTGGYSFSKVIPGTYGSSNMIDDWYKQGQLVWANVFWNPLPYLQLGVEYNWGKRTNIDGVYGSANRLSAMIQYNF